MTATPQDAASVRIPPPLVFLTAALLGKVLDRSALRLPLPGLQSDALRLSIAAVLACAGAALLIAAFGLFQKSGQDPRPWKPSPEIVRTGIYRWTRNPMYVGMALLQAALAVEQNNAWILALIPLSLLGVYWTAIRAEEAYLQHKFGQSYLDYRRAVRRWL